MSDECLEDESLERESELQMLYLRNMQMIKWRIEAIKEIWKGERSTTFKKTNIEFCILQIRKILELIVLSSLVSDADVYAEKLSNIQKMWNARLIIRDIERIHPDFFPRAIIVDPKDDSRWVDRPQPYLTKEQLIQIYEKCGRFLHEESPFCDQREIDAAYKRVWGDIVTWVNLIMHLLNTHTVHLYNQKDIFYIGMGGENERPHGNIFSLIEEAENQTDG